MITTDAETTVPVAALRLPGGVLIDHWLTPSDWSDDWPSLTKIRIVAREWPWVSLVFSIWMSAIANCPRRAILW